MRSSRCRSCALESCRHAGSLLLAATLFKQLLAGSLCRHKGHARHCDVKACRGPCLSAHRWSPRRPPLRRSLPPLRRLCVALSEGSAPCPRRSISTGCVECRRVFATKNACKENLLLGWHTQWLQPARTRRVACTKLQSYTRCSCAQLSQISSGHQSHVADYEPRSKGATKGVAILGRLLCRLEGYCWRRAVDFLNAANGMMQVIVSGATVMVTNLSRRFAFTCQWESLLTEELEQAGLSKA